MAEIIKAAPAKTPGLHVPESKLLKKESFTALNEAAAILDGAHAQAARIVTAAEHQREVVLAEARQAGEAEGLRRYLEAARDVVGQMDGFYQRAEPELVKLAAGIARKIVAAELAARPEAITQMVRQALAGVRQARRVGIQVHPAHVEALRVQSSALELSSMVEIQVIANETLSAGGCLIETELGMVDARLETQLQLIERVLARRSA